jgi:hypothetical protein
MCNSGWWRGRADMIMTCRCDASCMMMFPSCRRLRGTCPVAECIWTSISRGSARVYAPVWLLARGRGPSYTDYEQRVRGAPRTGSVCIVNQRGTGIAAAMPGGEDPCRNCRESSEIRAMSGSPAFECFYVVVRESLALSTWDDVECFVELCACAHCFGLGRCAIESLDDVGGFACAYRFIVSHVLIVSSAKNLLSRALSVCFASAESSPLTVVERREGAAARVGRPRARECSTLRVAGRESNRAPRDEASHCRQAPERRHAGIDVRRQESEGWPADRREKTGNVMPYVCAVCAACVCAFPFLSAMCVERAVSAEVA